MQVILMLLLISIKCPAIEGFVENFGRFIPCRGGGTATTYYTDAHDVDEDSRTIADCGGAWSDDTAVGVIARDLLTSDTSFSASWVASRLIYLS